MYSRLGLADSGAFLKFSIQMTNRSSDLKCMSEHYLVWVLGRRAPVLYLVVFSFSYFQFTAFHQSQ